MKNMKKILVIAMAVVLVALAAVAGTLAWLHDEETKNVSVSTYGKITLSLTAESLDDEILIPNRTYDISPEVTVAEGSEDCFVRVFVTFNNASAILATMGTKVDLDADGENDEVIFAPHTRVAGWVGGPWSCANITNEADWAKIYDQANNTLTYEFRYDQIVKKANNNGTPLPKLFTTFTLDKYLEEGDLEQLRGAGGLSISISAQAMQAVETNIGVDADLATNEHFENADAAWTEYEKQMDPSLRS